MKKEFVLTSPISNTRDFMGQIKIQGTTWMDNGAINVEVDQVWYSTVSNPTFKDWKWIPPTFWTWLDTSDRIGEIAFEHCKGLMESTRTQTEADLLLNNKLD